ncbi:MAG: hypothetical protein OXF54_05075 [Caldilineaceae bacterium]|nr:hypothetical protein [Caldilineaceae bacterium]
MLWVTNGTTMVDAAGREGGAISGKVSDSVGADGESDGGEGDVLDFAVRLVVHDGIVKDAEVKKLWGDFDAKGLGQEGVPGPKTEPCVYVYG